MGIRRKICWITLFLVGLMTILSPFPVIAQGDKIDLTLRLVPDIYYQKVTPDKDNIFYLEIKNTGNKAIANIRLYSDKPEKWTVEFKPERIDHLGVGSSQTININIKPVHTAIKGKYTITLIAEANETRKVSTFLRVETTTSIWIWVGVTIAALVVAGFVIIYLRFSRQ